MKKKKPTAPQSLDAGTARTVLLADTSNILRKAKAGKPLTRYERSVIERSATAIPGGPDRLFDSMAAAANALGLPLPVLKTAKRAGCPAFRAGGRVHSDTLKAWLADHGEAMQSLANDSPALQRERIRLVKAQADRLERENQMIAGTLIDVATVTAEWLKLTTEANRVLHDMLVDHLPPQLAGQSAEQVRLLMRDVHTRVCLALRALAEPQHTAEAPAP
jgi:phage terminase Nu1 subunit (DNA packaging protein)